MDTSKYTWNSLLFNADILVQKGCLNENQLKKIIDIVDIEKVVKFNKLTNNFIEQYVKPRIEKNDDVYDAMTMYDVYKIQDMNNKK
jgi:hypothetical protein